MSRSASRVGRFNRNFGRSRSADLSVPRMSRMTNNRRFRNLKRRVHQLATKQELNWIDTNVSDTISTTATYNLLNGCVVGDTVITRDGSQINCTSIQFRYHIEPIPTGDDVVAVGSWRCRVMVVWDRQCNGVAPTIAQILDNSGNAVNAPYRHQNKKRFKIVYDRTHTPQNYAHVFTGATAALGLNRCDSVSVATRRKLSRSTEYTETGVAGTVADINSNSLYLIHFCDDNTAQFTMVGQFRMYFKDK